MKTQYDIGVVAGDDGEARYTPMTLAGERMFSVEFETSREVDVFMDRMASNLSASTGTDNKDINMGDRYIVAEEYYGSNVWYRVEDTHNNNEVVVTFDDREKALKKIEELKNSNMRETLNERGHRYSIVGEIYSATDSKGYYYDDVRYRVEDTHNDNEVIAICNGRLQALEKAAELNGTDRQADLTETLQDRGQRYGGFAEHAAIAQELQRVMQYRGEWYRLPDPQRQALTTISDKIARILNGDPNYIDSWRDIAGYAQLVVDQLQNQDGATDAVVTVKTRRNGEWI